MPTQGSPLRPITRIFWVFATLGCGVIPSFLLFFWVERNMAVPGPLYRWLGWPWIAFWDASLPVKLLWDFGLFLGFGFFHTLLAQRSVQSALKKVLPVQCVRAFYLCITGLSALLLMGCWQSTGVIVWLLPGLPYWALSAISAVIYYGLLFFSLKVMTLFDPLEFLGFKQIYLRPEQLEGVEGGAGGKLLETGIYGRVRHPIYLFTLSAFIFTPVMSLDRLLFIASNILYLYFAIPIEERKLDARFGGAYAEYRTRVPAVIPRFSRIGSIPKTR